MNLEQRKRPHSDGVGRTQALDSGRIVSGQSGEQLFRMLPHLRRCMRCKPLVGTGLDARAHHALRCPVRRSLLVDEFTRLRVVVIEQVCSQECRMGSLPVTTDAMYFQAALPSDGRVQTVDVRDAAQAFSAATTADVAHEILLIAGDDSHRLTYAEVTSGLVSALGLPGAIPPGRPGNPSSDDDWYVTDWMDTTRAQEALQFQEHTWHDLKTELAQRYRLLRYLGWLIAPMVRLMMKRQSPYRNAPGQYADPWRKIRAKLGEPLWDRPLV